IARDGRGRVTVPLDEDVVEVARLLGRELAEPEVVEDQQVRGEPRAELALERVIGAGLAQGEQEFGDLDEADAAARAAGAVAERFGEPALADANRPAEDHVLLGGEPVEEQLADAGAAVVHRRLPDEVVVGDDLIEAGGLDPQGRALAVATVDLVLEE